MVSVPILMAGSEKQNHPIRQVFSNVDNDDPISDLKNKPILSVEQCFAVIVSSYNNKKVLSHLPLRAER